MKKIIIGLTLLSSISAFSMDNEKKALFSKAIEMNDSSIVVKSDKLTLSEVKEKANSLLDQYSKAVTLGDFNRVVRQANNIYPLLQDFSEQEVIILEIRNLADSKASELSR